MMKKAIIMLLTVLMLIAFVSCSNEPKISAEEMAKAIEDFYATAEYAEKYNLGTKYVGTTYNLANWNSTTASAEVIDALLKYDKKDGNGIDYSDFTVTSAEGTVDMVTIAAEVTDSQISTKTRTKLEGVKLTYSYTLDGDKKTGSVSIDYDVTKSYTITNDGTVSENTNVAKMIVNGKSCRPVEYTVDGSLVGFSLQAKKAICDGISLDCDTVGTKLVKIVTKY